MWLVCTSPLGHDHYTHGRCWLGLGQHRVRFVVVGQAQAELAVDLSLVGGVGVAEDGQQPAEGVDERLDFVSAHPPRASYPWDRPATAG